MILYIELEKEEEEIINNKDLIKNVNINKDIKIYWVEGENKWYLYKDCLLIKEGEIIKNDKFLDRFINYLCNICVFRVVIEKEVKKEVVVLKVEGVVDVIFKFIMYIKENIIMIFDIDNLFLWRLGKYNLFKFSVK